MVLREYVIVGRKIPSPVHKVKKGVVPDMRKKNEAPTVYRMRIFAKDKVIARNRYWYFLNKLKKIKRTHGEILAIHELHEEKPNSIKTFGILLRYNSSKGVHNIYKEYRELSRCDAITHMYRDMASQYRVKAHNVQVVECKALASKDVRRKTNKQFMNNKIRFPRVHQIVRPPTKQMRSTFVARRPTTVF
eukprot:TRINITY_DN16981_c0_g1_i1.p2 TRINITY_DN16981_c0_g1~~TRINITY_DN16981_c0_g1_i1.p2  ORF type:complete len:211 (+),score=65.45 TRINITY_DN16981_c0_g1_i1:64-633(+)